MKTFLLFVPIIMAGIYVLGGAIVLTIAGRHYELEAKQNEAKREQFMNNFIENL